LKQKPGTGLFVDLERMVEFAHDGIVSKTVAKKAGSDVTLFCMSTGQELSTHSASFPAIIHVLKGEGLITLGNQSYEAKPNAWFYMPKGLSHALQSTDNLVFLLTLLRKH
jgi:quercetin dioxygenase-like cupin family protein